MAGDSSSEPAVCPVDHKTREAWLEQARAKAAAEGTEVPSPHGPTTQTAAPFAQQTQPTQPPPRASWTSWLFAAQQPPPSPLTKPPAPPPRTGPLGTDREVSSIPRTATAQGPGSEPAASKLPATPVNHEVETGADAATGNWIYPSEKMFFEAMKRKGNDNARVADMKVVVPIHNAVNERAWKEICEWEAPYVGDNKCAGPRLHSFAGLSTQMSPKARINTLLGYQAPFDRHDWIVDRCGTQVDYVIDFYAGRPGAQNQQLSFYLDVRPKLNSWEGVKMRALRGLGLA